MEEKDPARRELCNDVCNELFDRQLEPIFRLGAPRHDLEREAAGDQIPTSGEKAVRRPEEPDGLLEDRFEVAFAPTNVVRHLSQWELGEPAMNVGVQANLVPGCAYRPYELRIATSPLTENEECRSRIVLAERAEQPRRHLRVGSVVERE